ncbi:MAG: D-alanine--D-alanine ligase [Oscillospiraceae bacterium]|nr:D-alanine--D-alanine ligase [Oscillospiraceae bacterium]
MAKIRAAVIFGGMSSEYEVSLQSAYSVIKNIDKRKYEVVCIGITKKGRWLYFPGDIEMISSDEWFTHPDCVSVMISPDRSHRGIYKIMPDSSAVLQKIDVVFPVLHGKYGEDGTIQGLLELSGIPFVGCDTLSSAVCLDKAMTHSVLDSLNIKNAAWLAFDLSYLKEQEKITERVENKFKYPVFVKPAKAGSSVGVSKAHNREELIEAVKTAFSHDDKVVVEETLVGKEVECAVMGNEHPIASIVGEILPKAEFYDYEAKYLNGTTDLLIPASITKEQMEKVQRTAVQAYKGLGCSGLTRMDFFVLEDGSVYLNEPNTLPGFTSISMYPKLFMYDGMTYSDIIDNLLELAIERADVYNG